MTTLTINIKGMTCGGCVKSVTNVLQQLRGVSKVDVSLAENHAIVDYDPTLASPKLLKTAIELLKTAIEDAGYDVVD